MATNEKIISVAQSISKGEDKDKLRVRMRTLTLAEAALVELTVNLLSGRPHRITSDSETLARARQIAQLLSATWQIEQLPVVMSVFPETVKPIPPRPPRPKAGPVRIFRQPAARQEEEQR